jgi:protein phosphatase
MIAYSIDCFGLSDRGRVRDKNEDQFLIAELNKSMLVRQTSLDMEKFTRVVGEMQGGLFLVADGMGGEASGDVASRIAVDSVIPFVLNFLPCFFRLDAGNTEDIEEVLKSILEDGQKRIKRETERQPECRGMGTTMTLAYLIWPRLYVVHSGDSRCYLLRDSVLKQITTDHTFAQALVDEGGMKPEQAEGSNLDNVLWNVLGSSSQDVIPDLYRTGLKENDTLLLCTDGLTGHLDDEEIAGLLNSEDSAERIGRALVDRANRAGGSDNVTVVVARFGKAGGPDEPRVEDARRKKGRMTA